MEFALAVVVLAVVALLIADAPRIALSAVFAAYILLPFTPVGRVFIGDSGVGIHVAAILVLMLGAAKLITNPERPQFGQDARRVPTGVHLLIVLFILGAIISQFASGSAPAASAAFIVNQIVAPYIFFLLCVDESRRDPLFLRGALKIFVGVGVLQSIIAIGVATDLWPQPYADAFSTNWWWRQEFIEGGRQVGTLDTPLNLGLFLAACVPLVTVFQSTLARMAISTVLVTGIFLTQSRIGLIAALIGITYFALYGIRRLRGRLALIATASAGYYVLTYLGVVGNFFARVADDKGSSAARSAAWEYLLPRLSEFLGSGVGVFESKSYLTSHGFYSSAESAILSYTLSFGLVFALCYFGAMVWLIIFVVRTERRVSAPTMSAILVLASIQLYSSVATESSAAFILWTTLFFAVSHALSPRPDPVTLQVCEESATHSPVRSTLPHGDLR